MMHFVTMATPIDDIDGKNLKTELKSSRTIFKQSYKVKIMPLVIYGLGGIHTHTFAHESDFKKPGSTGAHLV